MPSSPVPDSIIIYNKSKNVQLSYPVSIPRVFVQGEIAHYAQAVIAGSGVFTQCDVKNRWPDGSLKFAIVSFLVPALSGNGSVQVTFQDQSTGNNTGYLDSNGMLDSAFDFEGLIHMDNGAGIQRNISARAMLSAGKYSYWLQGPIVTAVRLADETTRAFDVNVDGGSGNPLHPIFEAWFYPNNRKVDIGYTVENAWMSNTAANSTRDQTYSFTLCAGNSNCSGNNPVLAFTQPLFTQIGWSRWHKDYWVKGPPSPIRVDFNSAYLLSTQALPNYNVNRDVSAAATKYIQTWTSMPAAQKSLTGTPGSCQSAAFGTIIGCLGDVELNINGGGAHEYVGPLPSWQVLYLLTWNEVLRDETLTNADLMGYWPIHFREADASAGSGHYFDAPGTGSVDTQGRFVSLNARQMVALHNPTSNSTNCGGTWMQDRPVLSGTVTQGNWNTSNSDTMIGASHQPDIAYLAYLVTGKNYYLEELQYQGAKDPGFQTGCSGNTSGIYDHHQGALGLFSGDSERQTGWGIRTLARAAFLSLDGTPEKAYLADKLQNNLAFLEGTQGLSNDYPNNATAYNYGLNWIYGVSSQHLPYFVNSDPFIGPAYGYTGQGALGTNCGGAQGNFQEYYLTLGVATARDLGWKTDSLLSLMIRHPLNVLFNPAIGNPYLVGDYAGGNDPGYAYCQKSCTTWGSSSCTTQGDWMRGWDKFTSYFTSLPSGWSIPGQMEDNYTAEAAAALAATANLSAPEGYTGLQGYNWLFQSATFLNTDFGTMSPKWDIVPRKQAPAERAPDPSHSQKAPVGAKLQQNSGVPAPAAENHAQPAAKTGIDTETTAIGWHTLRNTNVFHQLPAQGKLDFLVPVTNGVLAGSEAYSGGAADTDTNRLLLWGGGHQDYCGNEIYALDLSAKPPAMKRLNDPSQPSACNRSAEPSVVRDAIESLPVGGQWPKVTDCQGQNCRPNARHTVDLLAYAAHDHALLSIGGVLSSQAGIHSTGIWSLDLAALYAGGEAGTHWTRQDPTVKLTGGPLSAYGTGWGNLIYDARTHLAWVEGGPAAALYSYNLDTNTLKQASSSHSQRDGQMTMIYDPDHDYAWVIGGNDVFNQKSLGNTTPDGVGYWDLTRCAKGAGCSFARVSAQKHDANPHSVPVGCNQALTSAGSPGVAFDPIWHVLVIWQQPWPNYEVPEALYLFNPDANRAAEINALGIDKVPPLQCVEIKTTNWSESTGPAPAYSANSGVADVFGRFAYFPKLDVFAACHGYTDCKILRLRPEKLAQ